MKRKFLIAIVVVLSMVLASCIGFIVYTEYHLQKHPENSGDVQQQTDTGKQQDTIPADIQTQPQNTTPTDTQAQSQDTTELEESTIPDFTYEDNELPAVPVPQDTPTTLPAQNETSSTEENETEGEDEQQTDNTDTTEPEQTKETSGLDEDELPGAPIV